MTTRDPRLRDLVRPETSGNGRDPTASLSIEIDDADREPSHPSLALGTHEAGREERTKIESPGGRGKTPAPPAARASTRPPPVPRGDDPDHRIGSVLGSYKVLELLGKGGMGYVYRAEHVKLGREVALKLLRTDYAKRKDAVARFIQEARTVNRIRHRNIVDVPDILELEDGTTCIVMEYLRGQSLGKWARTGIDLPRALAVLVQICDGLSAAHAVNIVHRDLKPDNVIVVPTQDGAELVKLLDFGVAKLLNRDDEDIGFQTAAGSVIGTPAYMSPEQAGGMAIDARSDIYSLGAIMYELFCGQPMFRGRSFGEYVRKHLTEMPVRPKLTQGGTHLDDRLEAVILRCLEKDPNARFSHILELRDALLYFLGAIETLPPGFASLTASGVRPPPLPPLPNAAMTTMLPQAPIMGMPTPASGHHLSLQQSAGYASYGHYSQGVGLPPPAPVAPATPWWVWFMGGAVAVGLGVAAAVWVAGEDAAPAKPTPSVVASPTPATPEPTPDPTPAPVADSLPTVPAAPKQIQVRFDSLPSGGVYEAGRSAELCTTPCFHTLDLGDGGPADKRTFIVKADGYKDGSVVVDLTVERPNGTVTLEQLVASPTGSTSASKSSKSSRASKSSRSSKDIASEPTSVREIEDPVLKPAATKKPDKGGKIDRTDTLDPFKK